MSRTKTNTSGGGAFLTQNGEKLTDVKNEINELEQLLAAAGQTSQSTLLLKKRKEMREVDQSLDNMKNQHKQRMDACEERRVQFEAKQAKMREQVLRFEKFIQENDAKRQRAEGKAKQERKLYEDKLKEINALTDKIRNLELEQSQLTNLLVTNGCYKVYLERIVEEGEFGYEEISEILNRHNTLREANADLMQHSSQLETEVDEFRKNLSLIKTEKQNQLLVNTSIIQDLQNEYEKIQHYVKEKEEENIQKENKKKDISRELSQTTQAIRNLFGRCFNTMRIKPVFTTNTGTILTSQQQHNNTSSSNNNTNNNNTTNNTNNKDNSTSILEILDYELDIILMRISDLVEISSEYKYAVENGLASSSSMDLRENSIISMQTASKSMI